MANTIALQSIPYKCLYFHGHRQCSFTMQVRMSPIANEHWFATAPFETYLTTTFDFVNRLRHGGVFMADMIGALNWRNVTTIGTLSTGLPFPFGGSKLPDLTGKLSPLLDLSSRKTDEVCHHSTFRNRLECSGISSAPTNGCTFSHCSL